MPRCALRDPRTPGRSAASGEADWVEQIGPALVWFEPLPAARGPQTIQIPNESASAKASPRLARDQLIRIGSFSRRGLATIQPTTDMRTKHFRVRPRTRPADDGFRSGEPGKCRAAEPLSQLQARCSFPLKLSASLKLRLLMVRLERAGLVHDGISPAGEIRPQRTP
jgi:hypothetical protein